MTSVTHQLFVAEPPPHYMMRQPLVLDSSILCAMLFDEPTATVARQIITGREFHAPWLIDHEVASVASKKLRTGWIATEVIPILDDFVRMDIEHHPTSVTGAFELAQRYGLSTYDAAYLWLAAHLKVPLATFDEKLARAAKAHLADL